MRAFEEAVCHVCGERLFQSALAGPGLDQAVGAPSEELRCPDCAHGEQAFSRAVAYGSFEGKLRELIHVLKYEHMRPVAVVLGRRLAGAVCDALPECAAHSPLVIPVPLHKSKERQRGFNQAELIARALVKYLPATGWELNTSVLRRCRQTASQTGLTRLQRRLNVRGAFEVRLPEAIIQRDILLVDDVFTTGTTVSECARVLRSSGAAQVWVATVARALKPEANFTLREEPAGESETAHAERTAKV